VQEILWTEQSYVDTLRMIQDVFLLPLKEAASSGKGLVPDRQINVMFPEIPGKKAILTYTLIRLLTPDSFFP